MLAISFVAKEQNEWIEKIISVFLSGMSHTQRRLKKWNDMAEKLQGEFFPSQKSKYRVTLIAFSHTKPINQKVITDFLLKQAGGTVLIETWKNAIVAKEKHGKRK